MQTINVNRKEVNIHQILYLQAEINYTRFVMRNGREIVSSYTLQKFGNQLPAQQFRRINRGVILNSNFVLKIENAEITLINNDVFRVSRRRKKITNSLI